MPLVHRGCLPGSPVRPAPHFRVLFIILETTADFQASSLHSFQGVSQAGQQGGLRDGRSNLVREAFNTFDRLPQGCGANFGVDA